jgi:glycosyltransferase involved in cell wall biosynthesis
VNAEWSARLAARGRFEVVDLPKPTSFSPRPVDVYVHHSYDDEFPTISVPDEGKLIAVRTWDFGPFPPSWVAKINDECDRLWVHSAWVKSQAIAGGVQARKVRVIPHGIDERVFTRRGPAYPVPTTKRFRFLFVGATILRKGIDILLTAYGEAFNREDDVCLIIKDRPGDLFYRGISFRDRIMERARDRRHPEIAYLYRDLSKEELAALYRAADVAVFPYRAEGFALPILEGMACGLPPIVPRFGASLDYCTSASSFQVTAKRINLPINENLAINTLGFTADVTEVDFSEIPVDELARAMRDAYELSPDRLRIKARRAADRAHGRFTWDHTLARIERELADVIGTGTPERLRRRRAEHERSAKVFLAAREMYLNLDLAQSLPIRKR